MMVYNMARAIANGKIVPVPAPKAGSHP